MPTADQKARPDDWDRHWKDLEASTVVNPAQVYRRYLILANLDLEHAIAPRVLDIGSGLGDFLIDIHGLYPDVPKLGLELSRSGVEISSRRLPHVPFLRRDLTAKDNDPAGHNGFATHAVCSEVLEHVDNPVELLRNARPYMADGCRLVVTVPGGPQSAYDRYIGHRRHFTPVDLCKLLADAGFTVEFAAGAGFPFFNLYRVIVILRGNQLAKDASGKPSVLLKVTSAVFRVLFKFNLASSPFGWQIIAVARK